MSKGILEQLAAIGEVHIGTAADGRYMVSIQYVSHIDGNCEMGFSGYGHTIEESAYDYLRKMRFPARGTTCRRSGGSYQPILIVEVQP